MDLVIRDTSQAADFKILKTESFLRTVSKEVLSRPLILEANDILKIQAADANIFDFMVSYLDRDRD